MKKEIKPFSKMTKAEKAIALAKDVIKQVKAAKFVPQQGHYIYTNEFEDALIEAQGDDCKKKVEMQSLIPKVTCTCCAKGSLFLADILKRDKLKVDSIYNMPSDNEDMVKRLRGIFSKLQLDMIELAFEGVECGGAGDNKKLFREIDDYNTKTTELGRKCLDFGEQWDESYDRLMGIMKNVVKNKGEFTP